MFSSLILFHSYAFEKFFIKPAEILCINHTYLTGKNLGRKDFLPLHTG